MFVCFLLVCCCLLASVSFLFFSFYLFFSPGATFSSCRGLFNARTPAAPTRTPAQGGSSIRTDYLVHGIATTHHQQAGVAGLRLLETRLAPCRTVRRDAVMIYTERPAGKRSARCALTPTLSGHLRSGPPRAVGPCQGATGEWRWWFPTTIVFCFFFVLFWSLRCFGIWRADIKSCFFLFKKN